MGAEKHRKAVFTKIPKLRYTYRRFYSLLCDYTHPSFKGWAELLMKNGDGVYIPWHPNFNASYASECIGLIGYITIQSVRGYLTTFKEWLTPDLELEMNRTMPRVRDLLERNFEVREYNKKAVIPRQTSAKQE